MKKLFLQVALLFTMILFVQSLNSPGNNVDNNTKEIEPEMDLFLLIGQSNMAGRGELDSIKLDLRGIYILNKENEWEQASEPIHFDKSVAGACLATTFAIDVKNKSGKEIGLIPCAIGGTSIDLWMPDVIDPVTKVMPYNQTVQRVKKALESGTLRGILWHQGESDSSNGRYLNYADMFNTLLKNLSKDLSLNTDSIPVIVGELGRFFSSQQHHKEAVYIDSVLHQIAKKKNIYCISSYGLIHKGDSTHFDTKSLRELGKRYAEGYQIVLHRLQN